MDFYRILEKENRDASISLIPDYSIEQSKDLMIRGGSFYAVWDQARNRWSQNSYDLIRLVDAELDAEAKRREVATGHRYAPQHLKWSSTGSWKKFLDFAKGSSDHFHQLDTTVTFQNTEVKKTDYVSKRLPYALEAGEVAAWDELVALLYAPGERQKIEWAIGSIVAGDSTKIQKFFVFYGGPRTGKSTMLDIIARLFEGYYTTFDGKSLGSGTGGVFAMEMFKHNPLVAIQHDADLSRLDDNTRLNSIVSHEAMPMNEKYKTQFTVRLLAMLFLGSNQPVKISDAKSGMLRRLVDIVPTGLTHAPRTYDALINRIGFELGAIAWHCLQVYEELGRDYYNGYRPMEMRLRTDPFYNFIEAYFDLFKAQDYTTAKQAYRLYREYCEESEIKPLPLYKMRAELENYFDTFEERGMIDGEVVRSLFQGFIADGFRAPKAEGKGFTLVLEDTVSLLDEALANQPAQVAKPDGTPGRKWANVRTKLADIDTGELHYVKVPDNHVVIDFDLQDSKGEKALERNLQAASKWPPTYAEVSRSGDGVHLHYHYAGNVDDLAGVHSPGIEVKVYRGDASLRRRLSRCNAVPVSSISSGLPLKKKEKMLKTKTITSERGLRELIHRNLRKEIHPGTKPSVDFIKKILDDAHESGVKYDVTDLRNKIVAFANNSSNQAGAALKVVKEMKWQSEPPDSEGSLASEAGAPVGDERLVFFDVEVYPNLFVICWKFLGAKDVVRMVNPKAHEVEDLFKLKLVGFYNRRYDNHILYAASMGATPAELFKLSSKLVEGNRSATYGQAYNLSYADIWDFSSERMSLKKFEIKLGILHMELDLPWNEPVDEKDWGKVVEYCANDVRATEAVFEDRKGDFIARQVLAELSGLTVNDTTQNHTAKIIFGDDRNPQKKFVYTDLSKEFPGYRFELGKSSYKDEDPSEGGYVYAEPGMYENVAVLDIVSMHPTTIEILNLFGPYTKKFSDLKTARVHIKRGDFTSARDMMGGRLAPYLKDESSAEQLAYALKLVINTVYGLTSAKFDNSFRDLRNIDNIVAKRGALFMIDLKHYLQNAGFTVVHIKTDSVKLLVDNDPMAIAKVMAFGQMYSYEFEHEGNYDRFCLVNDAVFVAGKHAVPWDEKFPRIEWSATGAQFQHPFVFKTLFSGETIDFDDLCEARSVVKGTIYLDKDPIKPPDHTRMRHIGKTGLFVPVMEGGGVLYRVHEDKYYAVAGTKGHLWMEADVAVEMGDKIEIDYSYFEKLKNEAIEAIEKFGSFEEFVKPER